MKKTLIATAIAAVAFSGTTMAQSAANSADSRADELASRMDSMPQVYGNIQLAITHDNFDGGPSEVEHTDNGSTIGVKHDHVLAPGIVGFFKAELEFDADNKADNSGLDSFDEAYIGVRGDSFGQVWVGSDDSTYETAIDEISNFFEVASLNIRGPYDTGEGDLVQYMTPSFGGLTLGAAVQFNGDGDSKKNDKSYPYQLSAIYEIDALELAFAVDSNDGGENYSGTGASVNNENTYGLRASGNFANLRVTGQFQTRKDVSDIYGLMGIYTLGKNQFALAYEYKEADNSNSDKNDTITLQALHSLSDNMYVYVEGYIGGGDDVYEYEDSAGNAAFTDERTVAAVGATYYF
ncbi:MAG: porin [Oceanospirillales bacterium]|jgi:predicted porin|nr:porin [Oceanospirillales bacterium]